MYTKMSCDCPIAVSRQLLRIRYACTARCQTTENEFNFFRELTRYRRCGISGAHYSARCIQNTTCGAGRISLRFFTMRHDELRCEEHKRNLQNEKKSSHFPCVRYSNFVLYVNMFSIGNVLLLLSITRKTVRLLVSAKDQRYAVSHLL